jgi:hypothetical protein
MSGVTQLLLAAGGITYPPLTAVVTPGSQSWTGSLGNYTTTQDMVCTAGGGDGNYTYAWAVVSGTGLAASATASQTEANDATNNTSTFNCTVSDGAGSTPVVSNTVSVDP